MKQHSLSFLLFSCLVVLFISCEILTEVTKPKVLPCSVGGELEIVINKRKAELDDARSRMNDNLIEPDDLKRSDAYLYQLDSICSGLVHPYQMVIEVNPDADYGAIERYMKDTLHMHKIDSCDCDNLELWSIDKQFRGKVKINDNVTAANSKKGGINSADYDRYAPNVFTGSYPNNFVNSISEFNSTTYQGPKVAVLDTGVERNHPLVKDNLTSWQQAGDDVNCLIDDFIGWNYAYDNNDVTDDQGHGTHVAGIINQYLAGSAIDYEMVIYKTHDSLGMATIFDITCATLQSVRDEVDVINASFGYNGRSPIYEKALNKVMLNDIVFVNSAGNDGANVTNIAAYPAKYNTNSTNWIEGAPDLIVGVASMDLQSRFMPHSVEKSNFSNYDAQHVDIIAPGQCVNSAWPSGGSGMKCLDGTSMAAPMVTAEVIKHLNSQQPGVRAKNSLLSTSVVASNSLGLLDEVKGALVLSPTNPNPNIHCSNCN